MTTGAGLLPGIALTVGAMALGLYGLRGGWRGGHLPLSPELRLQVVTDATDQFVKTKDRCPDDTAELVSTGFLSDRIVRDFPIAILCVESAATVGESSEGRGLGPHSDEYLRWRYAPR
jgi:hypothetical protein